MVELKATVEVVEKLEPNVRQAFDDFLKTLPERIATVKVIKTEDEEPSDGERPVHAARRSREASRRKDA